jgi:hypothetical protein
MSYFIGFFCDYNLARQLRAYKSKLGENISMSSFLRFIIRDWLRLQDQEP